MQQLLQCVLAMTRKFARWDLFFEIMFVVGVLVLFVWFWLSDTF